MPIRDGRGADARTGVQLFVVSAHTPRAAVAAACAKAFSREARRHRRDFRILLDVAVAERWEPEEGPWAGSR
ncbi:hypothetical protein ACQKM2_38685 [Streptomyces sp. NPDC004126]|uniref:hypothetical protein n=1 Tax=Streptomyces sp. NPDC004126 TaxID=3390695 RepID=UPI003D03BE59